MSRVVGMILSGGAGSRLGGVNKGLVDVSGKPLVQWVYDTLNSQVDKVFISVNEDAEKYRVICPNILQDHEVFYRDGPLAGIQSLASHIQDSDIVQVVTCDLPLLPKDLVGRQKSHLYANQLDAVYPKDCEREHYGLLMFKGRFISQVEVLLKQDQRKIRDFIALMDHDSLFFDDANAFVNGNDWQSIEKIAEILKERVC